MKNFKRAFATAACLVALTPMTVGTAQAAPVPPSAPAAVAPTVTAQSTTVTSSVAVITLRKWWCWAMACRR